MKHLKEDFSKFKSWILTNIYKAKIEALKEMLLILDFYENVLRFNERFNQ